jgi:hypothetical protein
MRKLLLILLFALPSPQDVGSCYSVQPICIVGHPVCLCTITLNCYWACL